MSENSEMKVVPFEEVKASMDNLKSDVASLREQIASDKEATGLELEKRADDLQKAIDAADDHAKRLEEIDRKIQQNAYVSSFGESHGELKDALDVYGGGFMAFDGDKESRQYAAGAKPSMKHLVEGVFTGAGTENAQFHAPRHVAIKRIQDAADEVYAVDAMMRAQMDANALEEYRAKGGPKSLKAHKRFSHLVENFTKAVGDLIDTSTEVADWIPTQYSSQLYEQVKIGLPLVNLFPEISMGAPTVVLPLDMNDHEATRVTETTTLGASGAGSPWQDSTFMNPDALDSNNITLSAEKIRARYWVSREAEEDSIVAMLPFLNRKLRRGIGEALEDAILNGQVSGLDTGGTHFGKTNPSAASDARDCWDGLRYFVAQYTGSPATSVDHSNAAPTVVAMRGLRAAMGEYGVDPSMLAYIFGLFGYVSLLDDSNVMTLDKIGPQATVRTGMLAQVDGVDVLVSRRMPENANASGIIDGTTTNRTAALCVHTESCILGNRRRITLGQQDWISSDSRELVAFWRGDFQAVYSDTGLLAATPFIGQLYNIAAA